MHIVIYADTEHYEHFNFYNNFQFMIATLCTKEVKGQSKSFTDAECILHVIIKKGA